MSKKKDNLPDSRGHFGIYGGVYVAETLVPALEELADQYELIKKNKKFRNVNFRNKEVIRILQINGLSEVKKELFSYQKQKGDTKFEILKRQIQKYMMNIKNIKAYTVTVKNSTITVK